MKMRRVPASRPINEWAAGDFCWHPPRTEREDRVLAVNLPVMCDFSQVDEWPGNGPATWLATVPVKAGGGGGPNVWDWDGNPTAPTLTQSLRVSTGEAEVVHVWHGYVTAGELVFLDAHPPLAPGSVAEREGAAPDVPPAPEPETPGEGTPGRYTGLVSFAVEDPGQPADWYWELSPHEGRVLVACCPLAGAGVEGRFPVEVWAGEERAPTVSGPLRFHGPDGSLLWEGSLIEGAWVEG